MRGSIVKRGKNYAVILELDKDSVTGKRKQKWITVGSDLDAAEKKLTELQHQKDTGSFVEPSKVRVSQYLDRWLADYGKPNLSPRTFERYEYIIEKHLKPVIGRVTLSQLRSSHIQSHYTALLNRGLAPRSVKYDHTVIHKALNTALKWGLVSRNVADSVDLPKARRSEMQTWDETELTIFLASARDTEYHALFYLALFSGMRRSELLGLRWSDCDLIMGQVSVSRGLHHLRKGNSYVFTQPKSARSRRTIALSPSAVLTLKAHYDKVRMDLALLEKPFNDARLVFSTLEGKPYRPETISRAFVNLAVKVGIKKIRFHDARHTHASLMLKQGIHPKIVQERLGHSSIAITLDTYSHVAPGLQQAAANRFDEVLSPKYNDTVLATASVSKSVSKTQIVK